MAYIGDILNFRTDTNYAVSGIYTGIIPLTVTGPGLRWELDIPITYIVHESQQVCAIRVDSDDLDIEFDKVVRGQRSTWNIGFSFQVLGSEDVRFEALGPETPGPTFDLTGIISSSWYGPPSDPPWRDMSLSLWASGMENLSPGWYDHRWRLSVVCGGGG